MDAKELKKYIYDNDLTRDLLDKLGCHSFLPNYNKGELRCALPDEEDNSKVSIFLNEELGIRIYTKGKTIFGSIYDLVMYIYNISFTDACKKCSNLLGVGFNTTKTVKKEHPLQFFKNIKKYKNNIQDEQDTYELSILDKYSPTPHIELIRDCVFGNVIDKYKVLFDEKSERIIFPHFKYNDKNQIVGIVGRTVNRAWKELKIPKYFSMEGIKFEKSRNLYGLSHNIEHIKQAGYIVVLEAEKSVMKIDMYGYPVGVAVGSHDISDFQMKLLISLNVEIIIAFDKDVEEDHILNICKQLNKYRKVSYIKDKWNLLSTKDSPADKGHRKWKFLLRNRIEYNEVV